MYNPPPTGGESIETGGNSPPSEMGWGGVLPPETPPLYGGEFWTLRGGVGGSHILSKNGEKVAF